MTRALRTLVLVGMFGLVSPGVSLGGEVLLLIKDGRVMLSAQTHQLGPFWPNGSVSAERASSTPTSCLRSC